MTLPPRPSPVANATAAALSYWRMAQEQPIGLGLVVNDPAAAKRQLYAARAKAADPTLNTISIRTSPTNPATHLWLIRDRNAEAEAVAAADPTANDPQL